MRFTDWSSHADRAMVAALRAGGDSCFDVLRARKPSFFALFAAFGGGGAPDGLAGVSRDDALSFVEGALLVASHARVRYAKPGISGHNAACGYDTRVAGHDGRRCARLHTG